MSDYYEEDWDDPYEDYDDPEDDEHEFVSDCGDPKCLMNFAHHMRSECHTQEMIEAYERECNPRWYDSLMQRLVNVFWMVKHRLWPRAKQQRRCRDGSCLRPDGHDGECDDLPF